MCYSLVKFICGSVEQTGHPKYTWFLKNSVAKYETERLISVDSEITDRGTQREYSSKPLKHRIVKRILLFKR